MAAQPSTTAPFRGWQYTAANGALERNMVLNDKVAPLPRLTDFDILVKVISMSINPADHKVPELGMLSKVIFKTPATPGMDFSGLVAAIGPKVDTFAVGEAVFGRVEATQHGTLGEFIFVRTRNDACVSIPRGLDFDHAAAVGTAGLTAYEVLAQNVKAGDKVFIHGGSGGTGTFGIQIAKAFGCHVTVTCSAAKAALCKQLGADEAIDYRTVDVLSALKEKGQLFNLVVDNVGSPAGLYKAAVGFLLPQGKFIQVGTGVSWHDLKAVTSRLLLPAFLGGGQRKYEIYLLKSARESLPKLAQLLAEGKVKPVVDEVFDFENAPNAFAKLKSGSHAGKIVVRVSKVDE